MYEIIAMDKYGAVLYKAFTMSVMVGNCAEDAEDAALDYTTACHFSGEKDFYAKVVIREGSREWTKIIH